jgi:hypothetical protein
MTLWAFAKSPLMYGGDVRKIDPATYDIITNPTLLEINHFSSNNTEACDPSNFFFWRKIVCLWGINNLSRIISFFLQWQFPYDPSLKNRHKGKPERSTKGKKHIHSLGFTSCTESQASGWSVENHNQTLERICWKGSFENNPNPFCVHKRELQQHTL